MITGEVEAVDRKQKIRDRYKGVDISELEVIPAKIIEDLETSSVIRRVAAYIRVSTDNDEQTSSYELQKNYYGVFVKIVSHSIQPVSQGWRMWSTFMSCSTMI